MTVSFARLKLRGKLLALVLPLVIIPIFAVAAIIGFIANQQAYRGVTKTSKDDLQHLSAFCIDLLDSHYQQFQVYKQDKARNLNNEVATLTALSNNLFASGHNRNTQGRIDLETATREARESLKRINDGEAAFERQSFAKIKERIRAKKVGASGYIFCMDSKGTLTVHPDSEGKNLIKMRDLNGNSFIEEMCRQKSGWIRYPWQNSSDPAPRMKIVHYQYFEPWDWIVAVGSYEDEFYQEANKIKIRILVSMAILMLVVGTLATVLVFGASAIFTRPITHMMNVIQRIKRGNLDERMTVTGEDELSEMASAFNRMADIIQRNKVMEANLAQQGKMASLGVLSSGVAHEINNPLGVILGYAGYLETKLGEQDPNFRYIHEIKRESKRCRKIVQDLLSYARTPRPTLEPTDLNDLLQQIVDFAANHTDLRGITITTLLTAGLPLIELDGDQLRQVAINLILNAGGAMPEGGNLTVSSTIADDGQVQITFSDSGCGIPADNLEKIFEPFYTTKARGTGLGLAITRQIIEQHHGDIHIDSTVDTGTCVTITLPIEQEEL